MKPMPAWDLRCWAVGLRLLFIGLVLGGLWRTGSGLYEGPNFYAMREVEVVSSWVYWPYSVTGKATHSSTPHVRYQYRNARGELVSGKFYDPSHTPPEAWDAKPGDRLTLRVGGAASEPGARFGLNQRVWEGAFWLLTLLLLWAHVRFRKNPVGTKEQLQWIGAWFVLLYLMVWAKSWGAVA